MKRRFDTDNIEKHFFSKKINVAIFFYFMYNNIKSTVCQMQIYIFMTVLEKKI
ncbi:protein of unknown function [Brevefilum fermentans]|jgi:hypothetical protein|uniref:Uncharacterized protein n=1 Tax=Candidatus Brevifilum fermentans TaxID=1986204 RepID=A0A1Y6K4I7_9CHLR|nr:protein of unknown function [Brevefilum fermentans]